MPKNKLKEFEVTVTGFRTLLVRAKDSEDAHRIISNHNPHLGFDWEVDEYRVDAEPLTPEQVERAKRHGAVRLEDT